MELSELEVTNKNLAEEASGFVISYTVNQQPQPYIVNDTLIQQSGLPSGERLEDDYPYGIDGEKHSNFKLFGIGKETDAQKARRAKLKQVGTKILHGINKFNPASVALRGTVLSALRLNIFGNATRLYPAYLTDAELKAKNFDIANAQKAKQALEKVNAFYIKIGGEPKALKKEIIKAHDKPALNTKKAKARAEAEKKKNFTGQNYSNITAEVITAVSISTASLLTAIINAVGAKRNPYVTNTPQANSFDTSATDAPPPTPDVDKLVNDAQAGADADRAKGLPLDDTTSDDTILGMPKPVFWIGLGAILLFGGIIFYKKVIAKK